MNKILIIGQAPAANKQDLPYDSTMLYNWLKEIGINPTQAQTMFEFEAIYNEFPGFDKNGGHLKPSKEQMTKHWVNTLENKVICANKVWLLGNVANEYFNKQPKTWSCTLEVLRTIHPSFRNFAKYKSQKEELLKSIKEFINM